MTLPEVALWRGLRGRGGPVVFRRQHPFGTYILDFYCPRARLAVEVDGRTHELSAARDARRDAWLAAQGVSTFRIPAAAVLADPDWAVAEVHARAAEALAAAGPPLPR